MNRRSFLAGSAAAAFAAPVWASLRKDRLDDAAGVLEKATASGQVASAVLHVRQGDQSVTRRFGNAKSDDAMFLLGSITKPICVTALMTLFDKGEFALDDPLKKFIPEFTGDGRDQVTMRHLLSHVSGLPDQLPNNDALRRKHAELSEFVEHSNHVPLAFAPGTKYQYSSMGILLAVDVARRITGTDTREFVDRAVFQPLGMKHSVLGIGRFKQEELVPMQTEHAAPEAGAGDPTAKEWDWNSAYWRKLGAPWGAANCSAADVGRFLAEFLHAQGKVVKPATARLMTTNQNPPGMTPRGLGLNVGLGAGSKGCSEKTFGHTGSTGTIAWADPATDTICVVLTSLPARAVQPHPRDVAAAHVAAAAE